MSAHSNAHIQQPVVKTYMLDIVRNGKNFSRIPIKIAEKELDEPGRISISDALTWERAA